MNIPNRLTLARLFLTVLFVGSMSITFPGSKIFAALIFLLATLTDYLDGVLARKLGLVTDFGKLMDPLADKIITASAFILFIPLQALPAWVVIIIISREFLITGLRVLANSKGIILPAERLGKHKTAWQMFTILYFLFLLAAGDFYPSLGGYKELAWHWAGGCLVGITTLLTIYSGAAYLWKNRNLISDS